MGFECRFLGEGSGELDLLQVGNAHPVFVANKITHPHGARGSAERMILGSRHSSGATLPKRREASQKWSAPMSCQGVQPKSFVPGEAGLR
jgi:hypothetical protein